VKNTLDAATVDLRKLLELQNQVKRRVSTIYQIISLRVEVSLFVLGPEIKDRDEVEVGNWAKHKKTFYS
jgi:hypothetical protein